MGGNQVKKRMVLVLVVCMLVPMITVCGSASQQAFAAEASPGDAVELRFIDVSPGTARQNYYEATFKKFEEETGIKVVYESVPWDDAADKLTAQGATGQLPDVITTHAAWLGQFIPAGWIIPLDGYLAGIENDFNEYVKNVVWKGQKETFQNIYTVPDGMMVQGIYYRKDWAAEKDLSFDDSWTYDDYFTMIRGLADPAQNRYGNSYRGARGGFDIILMYMLTFTGGSSFDDEGNYLIADNPDCLEAFKKWTSVYIDGAVPQDSINWGFVEMVDGFTGGLTGTLQNDSEVAVTCLSTMEDDQWGVMPLPVSSVDGKRLNNVNSPYSYSISSHSGNPDVAFKLVEYLSRPDNSIEYCKLTGQIPVMKDTGGDPLYGPDGPFAAFMRQLNDPALTIPVLYPPFEFMDMHQGMLHEEVQKYLLGRQSAEDVIRNISMEMSTRMKAYLADNPGAVVETPKTLQ